MKQGSTSNKSPAVGEPIEAYCTFCKLDLNHIVVAHKDNTVHKVRCSTCNREHTYRIPRRLLGKKATKARKPTVKSKAGTSGRELNAETAIPYNTSHSFGIGDCINHDRFGLGEVVAKKGQTKIQVSFKDATRLLVCAADTPMD
ncbi:hypothetical protein JW905_09585 [bacterium]|nr:hypothetical protein [candidate division CSSED10-310 bacterium]